MAKKHISLVLPDREICSGIPIADDRIRKGVERTNPIHPSPNGQRLQKSETNNLSTRLLVNDY